MTSLNRMKLQSRYAIAARLVMDTALHIGGGRNPSAATDSPVVRDGAGQPFIPGSSLKGAFRAAVERLVAHVGLKACGLTDASTGCLTALSPGVKYLEAYQAVSKHVQRRVNSEIQEHIQLLGGSPSSDGTVTDETLLMLLERHLCDVCKTFGSPYLASAVYFHDAAITAPWSELPEVPTQIRDGVGIDRDSERAREGIKYDFEVVPPQTMFDFRLNLENPSERDLGLVALGLQEFINGQVPLGGIRSRGLGFCHLEDVKIESVDFSKPDQSKAYLLERKMVSLQANEFLQHQIGALLTRRA